AKKVVWFVLTILIKVSKNNNNLNQREKRFPVKMLIKLKLLNIFESVKFPNFGFEVQVPLNTRRNLRARSCIRTTTTSR
ncbi:hypothetical protein LINGRAHAP2_LOCUS35200, partial [Linum grandiflorum]